ncbi:unnamed protein product [Brassicogethes aeneus]|uniref:Uncharacterized protein n=1 Tax=Brassicogethes aeneus TaxID=1431903 RepID=A0A9P0BC51_BRAAE|nr:unnamed protein product [Brassicogethes aeneus]
MKRRTALILRKALESVQSVNGDIESGINVVQEIQGTSRTPTSNNADSTGNGAASANRLSDNILLAEAEKTEMQLERMIFEINEDTESSVLLQDIVLEENATEAESRIEIEDTPVMNAEIVGYTENSSENTANRKNKIVKKKISDPKTWKQNIRKKLFQEGKQYTSSRGKKVNEKKVPIYTVHAVGPDNPKKSQRGKNSPRKINEASKQSVIDHINKFPAVESHYCRTNTKRNYLESTLSVKKMYDLYLIYCESKQITPVKLSMYRFIFNTNFNYSFHVPKKDVCEKCATYYTIKAENNLKNSDELDMENHTTEKEVMRKEKSSDKNSNAAILTFDLENVITCPRSNVGNHFYLQKLSMYNLTGHFSTSNTAYCILWMETMQGRSGNCLASAFKVLVEKVLENNHIEHLVTWSDSCVPQNRNSHIAFSALDILRNHDELQSITMKYSIPGHGAVQEVDNIHSQIENHMSKKDFFSPLGFVKELKQIRKGNPFVIHQMKQTDFYNFEQCSSKLNYAKVPFTKVSQLKFEKSDINMISFKIGHCSEFQIVSIYNTIPRGIRSRKSKDAQPNAVPLLATIIPKVLSNPEPLAPGKVLAIKKMMTAMPQVDQDFYKALLGFN